MSCSMESDNRSGLVMKPHSPTPTDAQDVGSLGSGSSPTKNWLVSLPLELILEITEHCALLGEGTASALSCVDTRLRWLCATVLFRKMRINCPEDELGRHLAAIQDNHRILQSVRVLDICTEGPDRSSGRPWRFIHSRVSDACSDDTPVLLATVLQQMTNLKDLCLDLRYSKKTLLGPLRKVFLEQSMTFPTVRGFAWAAGTTAKFIPDVFPNLHALSLHLSCAPKSSPGLKGIAPKLQQLRTLELYKPGWTCENIAQVQEMFPEIKCLILGGGLRDDLWNITPSLDLFQNVKTLALGTCASGGRVQRVARSDRGKPNLDSRWRSDSQAWRADDIFSICRRLETAYLMSPNYRSVRCTPNLEKPTKSDGLGLIHVDAVADCGEYGWPSF
ncbi:hypothetical protein CkaCkLH20_10042 [Colletotrichum karsti]|uniref:Uncharacterized protein n=1 Tax=Colletotrichum karsti TaxID=1095194 RepID=A0A9P6I5U6_9PEZI|nr:uncharacterized protein CkaCkLH20_10042 [Colletotrichum karsti]KAF9872545.1 hypothetical protein CkaCkLH20_10042 [Colletotrichum karsti]